MKKSLRLLFAITFMAAAMAATSATMHYAPQHQLASGGDPCPLCPPPGCDDSN